MRRLLKILAISFILYVYPFLLVDKSTFQGVRFDLSLLIVVIWDIIIIYNMYMSYRSLINKLNRQGYMEKLVLYLVNNYTFTFNFFISETEDNIYKILLKMGVDDYNIMCLIFDIRKNFYDLFVFNLLCVPLAVLMVNITKL